MTALFDAYDQRRAQQLAAQPMHTALTDSELDPQDRTERVYQPTRQLSRAARRHARAWELAAMFRERLASSRAGDGPSRGWV